MNQIADKNSAASAGLLPSLEYQTGIVIAAISRWLAICGGTILAAMAVMSVASIIGRALIPIGLQPIPGDFELIETGCAIAVFSFMPWCQYNRGHVTVDILSNTFPQSVQAVLMLIGNCALTLVALVVAIQLWPGLIEKYTYGETTFILGMPVWYGYSLSMIGAVFFAITCLYTIWRSLNELISGQLVTDATIDH